MPTIIENYPQQLQCRSQWCWAAMAVSLIRYKGRDQTITQCRFVKEVLGIEGCCNGGCGDDCTMYLDCNAGSVRTDWCVGPAECDKRPDDITKFLSVLRDKYGINYTSIGGSPTSLTLIEQSLAAKWPVFLVRLDRSANKHVLSITGVDGDRLTLLDSEGDCKQASFDEYHELSLEGRNGQKRAYIWDETYYPL